MTSHPSSSLASPGWVALDPGDRSAGAATRPLGSAPAERRTAASRGAGARFDGVARRRTERLAAAVLAAMWVVLWAVFVAGVLIPAASVHGGGAAAAREAQGV